MSKLQDAQTFWEYCVLQNVDKSALSHIPSYSENLEESICEEKKIIGNACFLFWTLFRLNWSHKECQKTIETLYLKKKIDKIGLFEITSFAVYLQIYIVF